MRHRSRATCMPAAGCAQGEIVYLGSSDTVPPSSCLRVPARPCSSHSLIADEGLQAQATDKLPSHELPRASGNPCGLVAPPTGDDLTVYLLSRPEACQHPIFPRRAEEHSSRKSDRNTLAADCSSLPPWYSMYAKETPVIHLSSVTARLSLASGRHRGQEGRRLGCRCLISSHHSIWTTVKTIPTEPPTQYASAFEATWECAQEGGGGVHRLVNHRETSTVSGAIHRYVPLSCPVGKYPQ